MPSHYLGIIESKLFYISIHKALAGLDVNYFYIFGGKDISIHKALAGLDD